MIDDLDDDDDDDEDDDDMMSNHTRMASHPSRVPVPVSGERPARVTLVKIASNNAHDDDHESWGS